MDLYNLLNTQKDSLFKILVDEGFNPQDFKLEDSGISILRYVKGNYYCKFQMSDDYLSRMIIFSPGTLLQEEYYANNMGDWHAYEKGFRNWLTNLKRELNADFLWEKLRSESSQILISKNISNEAFLPFEKEMIHQKFESIMSQLKNLELSHENLDIINEKLNHLLELTEKLDKVDWLSILIGSIAGLIVNLSITQDTVRTIWEIIKHEFQIWLYLH
jgi:hypothetical protein